MVRPQAQRIQRRMQEEAGAAPGATGSSGGGGISAGAAQGAERASLAPLVPRSSLVGASTLGAAQGAGLLGTRGQQLPPPAAQLGRQLGFPGASLHQQQQQQRPALGGGGRAGGLAGGGRPGVLQVVEDEEAAEGTAAPGGLQALGGGGRGAGAGFGAPGQASMPQVRHACGALVCAGVHGGLVPLAGQGAREERAGGRRRPRTHARGVACVWVRRARATCVPCRRTACCARRT